MANGSIAWDVHEARTHFPGLRQPQIFMDNAGGSQILGNVTDSIRNYLITTNVQLGASYSIGQISTGAYEAGFQAGARYINATRDEIVIGPSTTQLFRNLSLALRPHFIPGSEIILSGLDHEANISSWLTVAADLNLTIKWWRPKSANPNDPQLTPESLEPLLSDRTRLVTCTQTSNILGTITPVRAISDLLHSRCPEALLCVDAVAYAPHRPMDVVALGVDIYAFSWYKVYGPHIAQLFVKREVQDRCLRTLGHFFKPTFTLEDKLGLAAASYELMQAIPLVCRYLHAPNFWHGSIAHEVALQSLLLGHLTSKPDVYTIYGTPKVGADDRVPVISWVINGRSSREVVENIEKRTTLAFRWGHFFSKRLVNQVLGLDDNGVIRASLCHYNTIEEVKLLISELEREEPK